MYSFLVARIKDEDEYEWFTYKGKKPVMLDFRGSKEAISKNDKFGVRKSSNGKNIRLIKYNQPTRVFTLTLKQAKDLAKGV